MTAIAADLRRQAHDLSEQRPLQTVMPFLKSDTGSRSESSSPRALEDRRKRRSPSSLTATIPNRKKGK